MDKTIGKENRDAVGPSGRYENDGVDSHPRQKVCLAQRDTAEKGWMAFAEKMSMHENDKSEDGHSLIKYV